MDAQDNGKTKSIMERYHDAMRTTDGHYVEGANTNGDSLKIAVLGDSVFAPLLDDMQSNLSTKGIPIALIDFSFPWKTAEYARATIGDVIAKRPDVVVVELGGNDGNPQVITENLLGIIQSLRKEGIKVAVVGIRSDDIPHMKAMLVNHYGNENAAQRAQDFDAAFVKLNTSQHAPDYYYPSLFQGLSYPKHFGDNIHPNKEGQRILAQKFTDFFAEIALKEAALKKGRMIFLPQTDLNNAPPREKHSSSVVFPPP